MIPRADLAGWRYAPKTGTLDYRDADGTELYWIPLERCRTSAEVLDWIAQVAGKAWADDACLAGLVRAFDETLDLQGSLCGSGVEHGPINPRAAALRARDRRRTAERIAGVVFRVTPGNPA